MTAKRAEAEEEVDYGSPPGLHPMNQAEFDAFVQEGLDDIGAGRVVPHEVVVAEMRAYFAQQRAR